MLFKGTERRGVGEVAGEIEGAGGRINAYTSHDVTVYHVDAARRGAGARASTCSPTRCCTRSSIRRRSRARSRSCSRRSAAARTRPAACSATRSSPRPSACTRTARRSSARRESVSAFDRDASARLPRALVRAGQPRRRRGRKLRAAPRCSQSSRPRSARRGRTARGATGAREPPQRELRAAVLTRPFERASVELALAGRRPRASRRAAARPRSPSCSATARARAWCAACASATVWSSASTRGCYTPLDPGIWSIELETDAARAAEALGACALEVERLRSAPVSEAELEKARVNFLAAEHFERESVSGVAAKLGSFHCTGGGLEQEQRYLDAVRRATPDDLLRVARDYLAPERLTAVALLPEADARALDAAAIAAAVARGGERARRARRAAAAKRRAPPRSSPTRSTRASGCTCCRGATCRWSRRARRCSAGCSPRTRRTRASARSSPRSGCAAPRAARPPSSPRAVESRAADIDGFAGRSSFGLTLEAPSAAAASRCSTCSPRCC